MSDNKKKTSFLRKIGTVSGLLFTFAMVINIFRSKEITPPLQGSLENIIKLNNTFLTPKNAKVVKLRPPRPITINKPPLSQNSFFQKEAPVKKESKTTKSSENQVNASRQPPLKLSKEEQRALKNLDISQHYIQKEGGQFIDENKERIRYANMMVKTAISYMERNDFSEKNLNIDTTALNRNELLRKKFIAGLHDAFKTKVIPKVKSSISALHTHYGGNAKSHQGKILFTKNGRKKSRLDQILEERYKAAADELLGPRDCQKNCHLKPS